MRPIDNDVSISMKDANGEGKLKGIIENVPLDFGSVQTRANFYVGDQAPFDMLLGRPWQRGNRVSIDEDDDGTYLVSQQQKQKKKMHRTQHQAPFFLCNPTHSTN